MVSVSVRQPNIEVAQWAQVTMLLRETESRAVWSQNLSTHRGLVTLLATQHLMLSVSGNREYGRGPGHMGDHHHPNTGQTGLAVLKIMQGCNECLYMNSLTWFRGSSPEALQ